MIAHRPTGTSGLRLSLGHVDQLDDTVLRFAAQLGVTGVQFHNPVNLRVEDGVWRLDDLDRLVERCHAHGLHVDGIENVPLEQFWAIQQGAPERDRQLDRYCRTIERLAAAGIDWLGYHFITTYVWRSDMRAVGRGGARVTAFDLDTALREGNAAQTHRLSPYPLARPLDADTLQANHDHFLATVLPVAEAAGVRLALHPDDPPVTEPLGGAARIFTTPASLIELGRRITSPAWGLNLCVGTVSEMGGEPAVLSVIDALAPIDRIAAVHFRDVQGTAPSFTECFLGEGNCDPATLIRHLADGGFDGFVIDDHVPALDADADTWGDISAAAYCSHGRAHAIGYLQGLLNAVAGIRPATSARPGG